MSFPLYQVNAFAEQGYKGNPAAVVILDGPKNSIWMQSIASEMNLSETAFVYPRDNGYNLQWFTPETEVELCGHATLAAAHILWETDQVKESDCIRFSTLSGWITAEKKGEIIELDFPSAPLIPADLCEEMIAALGPVPDFAGLSGEKWLLDYHDEKIIQKMKPNFQALRELSPRSQREKGSILYPATLRLGSASMKTP
jgi:PhzF family phenazine biosynthesis protein